MPRVMAASSGRAAGPAAASSTADLLLCCAHLGVEWFNRLCPPRGRGGGAAWPEVTAVPVSSPRRLAW